MRVLVTNDDGVVSPGLWALAEEVRAAGHDTVVAAPAGERSGSGAAIGHLVPGEGVAVAAVERPGWEGAAWAVDGAPALCVLLAARLGAFGGGFDAVMSGINPGWNTGRSVIHSGTVGAVLTAANQRLSGIAVSIEALTRQVGEVGLVPGVREHWATAATLAVAALARLPEAPPETVLNLNVPNVPLHELRGVRSARLGRFAPNPDRPALSEIGPDGRFRIDLPPPRVEPIENSDNLLLRDGWATITSLVGVLEVPLPDLLDDLAQLAGESPGTVGK